jgi:hypothetical protein
VDGRALVEQIQRRITRHVVMVSEAGLIGSAFWTLQTWLHAEIALYSPILAPTSAEAEQGKSTLLEVISWMVPRRHVEVTPKVSLYATIDQDTPTLFIEEGEKLFKNRDLEEIINSSWMRNAKVWRMVRGVSMVGANFVEFHRCCACHRPIAAWASRYIDTKGGTRI